MQLVIIYCGVVSVLWTCWFAALLFYDEDSQDRVGEWRIKDISRSQEFREPFLQKERKDWQDLLSLRKQQGATFTMMTSAPPP